MATYNGARYLRQQLDSIANQTVRPERLIIVDDCSTDDSVALLKSWAADKPWVHIHSQEANQGVNTSFQTAWQLSRADWVFFADQDDIWLQDKIERFLPLLQGADLCYSDASVIDEHGNTLHASELRFHHTTAISGQQPGFFLLNNSVSGHNLVASHALLTQAGAVPPGMLYDHWLALLASCGSGIRYLPTPTCQHRMHNNNLANNPAIRRQQHKLRDRRRVAASATAVATRVDRMLAALRAAGKTELCDWLLLMNTPERSDWSRLRQSIALRDQLLPHHHGWSRWRRLWKLRHCFGQT